MLDPHPCVSHLVDEGPILAWGPIYTRESVGTLRERCSSNLSASKVRSYLQGGVRVCVCKHKCSCMCDRHGAKIGTEGRGRRGGKRDGQRNENE